MSRNSRVRSNSVAYIFSFFLLWPLSAFAQNGSSTEVIPEYYLVSKNAQVCVVRGDISGIDSASARKAALLEFVNGSYAFSNKWKQDFILSAIDYIDYRYFHAVLFRACAQSDVGETQIRGLWDAAARACGQRCSDAKLKLTRPETPVW